MLSVTAQDVLIEEILIKLISLFEKAAQLMLFPDSKKNKEK